MYQPLAHPLGANFQEFVEIIRYGTGRWWLKLKSSEALYGDDDLGHDYGKNIYKSYFLRVSSYENKTGQGIKTYLINSETSFNYIIVPKWNLNLQFGYKFYYRSVANLSHNDNYLFFGITTMLYNNETDY
jgi:hypothetical protein